MRRIETRHRSKLYHVRTPSLDDIEGLCDASHNLGFAVSFSDERHEFDSLQEVIENRGENVPALDVVLTSEDTSDSVILSFSPFAVSTSASGTSPGIKALWTELDSILSARGIRFYRLHSPHFWGGMITGSFVAAVGFTVALRQFQLTYFLFPGLTVLGFLFSVWEQNNTPALFLNREHRKTNFLKRNADKIILLILGTVLGLVLKVVYDYVTR